MISRRIFPVLTALLSPYVPLIAGLSTKRAATALSEGFYIESPLLNMLTTYRGMEKSTNVHLKMEFLQPSGSFKDRGIGHMIHSLYLDKDKPPMTKLVSSSGGNAGHSVATVGLKLGIPVDVFVPVTTKPMMVDKLKQRKANVIVEGENWNAADALARKELARVGDGAYYIPPFDDPLIWDGHSTIVDEVAADVAAGRLTSVPDAIVLSVGGGGLLRGVQLGLRRHGWVNTKIFAVETTGAASFAAAAKSNPVQPVNIGAITSVATSLGALQVTPAVLEPTIIETESIVVEDVDAVRACIDFLGTHRALVEPACGTALAVLTAPYNEAFRGMSNVVVIVCGGSVVDVSLLQEWKESLGI